MSDNAAPDPVDVRDFFEERAALTEFESSPNVPRRLAESVAIGATAREFGLTRQQIRELIKAAGSLS